MDRAISIRNLSFTYPNGFPALKNINLEIKENEFVAIIGQNGAGKSTLLKNITGLLKPQQGEVFICGENTKDISVARLATKIGFVLQNPDRQLFADTVEDEIMFGPKNLKLSPEEIRERLEMAIRYTGLEDMRQEFPPALSAGDRAKVIIGSVIAMKPQIIILDEPTTGQDTRGCSQIMNIAREFHQAGHTVIVVTHHMALVAEYASRAVVFCKGQVLLDGSVREVFSQDELLKETYIIPPQITQAGKQLQEKLGYDRTILHVNELSEKICSKINKSAVAI